MRDDYSEFLASKRVAALPSGFEPWQCNPAMREDQRVATEFCLRQGRAALFLDTGLGKTFDELEWSYQAGERSNGVSLILTPLAVARQIEREAKRFGYNARVVRDQSEVRRGINICNYDRLDKLDASAFGSVALDESSCIKAFDGKTTMMITQMFARTPFRLCATATPAPNDHMELATHAEFLGLMSRSEMLTRWFIHDSNDTKQWRLKGHATEHFWDWVASWAVMAETPADLGYNATGFDLPELRVTRHRVASSVKPKPGTLFAANVSATDMFALKRQTCEARAGLVGDLVRSEPDHAWVIWCDTNEESAALSRRLPDAALVEGAMSIDDKEAALNAFATGDAPQIITKPSISGWGVNWQHADRMAFVGRTFSYESEYQAVRRCYRYGQHNAVHVHVAIAEGEDHIGRVVERKAEAHRAMKDAMRRATARNLGRASETRIPYHPTHIGRIPEWLTSAA
jgi:superfamily II DNA or RNA helicase